MGVKITDLPAADPLGGLEPIETVQGGVSKKTNAGAMATRFQRVDDDNFILQCGNDTGLYDDLLTGYGVEISVYP